MSKTKRFLISLTVFLILVIPAFSFGAGLVPCGSASDPLTDHPCEFKDVLTLINKVIKFILFDLVVPIAAIMFFYAGFKMVTSGGSTEARSKAKNVFSNTVFGLVIAVGAWLIIRTILSILGYDGDWIGFTP